jgi:uncharacterized protein (DUF885 family)
MSTLTFDTLKFANRLKTAGVPSTHAEAEAEALSEVFEANLSELATKQDILEFATKQDIADLRRDMEGSAFALQQGFAKLRHDMDARFHNMDARFHDMDAKFEKTIVGFRNEMSEMKFELLKWIIGLAVAQTGLLLGLLKFFPINS